MIGALALAAAGAVLLAAQTQMPAASPKPPAQTQPPAPQPRVLDIGADKAPLSVAARNELTNAVNVHDYSAERTVLEREITANPKSAELRLLLGRIAFLEHQPKDAADNLAKADQLQPLNETDRLTMALGYQLSSRYELARTEMEKLRKAEPKNAEYAILLARIEKLGKRDDDAVREYRRAIALDPETLKAYEELGRTLADKGGTDEARQTFEEGARRNRLRAVRSELPPMDLAMLLRRSDDLAGAEKMFRESIEYNPKFQDAHYQLGLVLKAQKKDGDAISEFQQAVKLQPRYALAWLALGQLLDAQGQTVEALDALTRYKKLADEGNKAAVKP